MGNALRLAKHCFMLRAMTLSEWLELERGRGAAVAAAIGKTPAFVSQMALRVRPVPADKAPAISRCTDNMVQLWELRPHDWHRIWPELVGSEGAPPVQAGESVA